MKRIFLSILLIALVVGGVMWVMGTDNNRIQAQAGCSGASPKGSAIHFEHLTGLGTPKINKAVAVELAKANAAVPVTAARATKAQYVLFSDDARGTADKIGDDDTVKLAYQNVPAWVVTFCGVHVPVFIPFDVNDVRIKGLAAPPETHEWNVVINAETGEYMEEFSFQ